MSGNYGVIAEGWINGKWYSSLGKAGVDKNGRLKKECLLNIGERHTKSPEMLRE